MGLYKLFSYNVEVHYKSCLLSKAMLFTVVTTLLNIILPFILAYRSRGFWLKSHNFYEQPQVQFRYEYLLVAETVDPSRPIVCGDLNALDEDNISGLENCVEIQVQEYDYNEDDKNDELEFKIQLNVPPDRTVTSMILILGLDFQLKSVCPLHMQSLAIINKDFAVPPSGLRYYGDLQFYQVTHLPCVRNEIHTKYNISLFNYIRDKNENIVDFILWNYHHREVLTEMKPLHALGQNGHTDTMNMNIWLRIPEMNVQYTPSLLQELKWAWPQYLSFVVVFYYIFTKIKRFVFNNRLLMAWEVVPWKKL